MKTVQPTAHEFDANYLFADLTPYWAFDRTTKKGDGSYVARFQYDDQDWIAKAYYDDDTGIAHPGDELPDGTPFNLEEVKEFRLHVTADDDTGERKFNAHIAPRWQGMDSKEGYSPISVPPNFQGINVRIQGSNIPFTDYQDLLARAASAVGISAGHFRDPHEYSNIQDAALYVRLDRDASGPIHARDGPLAELGHLLESDRDGYRKVVQQDQDGNGDQAPGYYHTTTLDPDRCHAAFGSRTPMELKHYLAREAESLDEDNLLAHPKVEAAYQVSRWDETIGVTTEEIETLRTHLEEALLAILADAGLDLRPSETGYPYVDDAYFDAAEVDRGRRWEPVELNLSRLRQEQEHIVVRQLSDGLSPVEFEALDSLVTDGGQLSPQDIADDHDRHVDSVRRALKRMDDLVRHEYASVELESRWVAELVHEHVTAARERAEDAVQEVAERSAKALQMADRGLSAFTAWAAQAGVDVEGVRDAKLTLRFGEIDAQQLRRSIKQGLKAWKDAGMPPEEYRQAEVRSNAGRGVAWRWLKA